MDHELIRQGGEEAENNALASLGISKEVEAELSFLIRRKLATPEGRAETLLEFLQTSPVEPEKKNLAIEALEQVLGQREPAKAVSVFLIAKLKPQIEAEVKMKYKEWEKVLVAGQDLYQQVLQGRDLSNEEIGAVAKKVKAEVDPEVLWDLDGHGGEKHILRRLEVYAEDGAYDRKAVAEGRPTVAQMEAVVTEFLKSVKHITPSPGFWRVPRLKRLKDLYEAAIAVKEAEKRESAHSEGYFCCILP